MKYKNLTIILTLILLTSCNSKENISNSYYKNISPLYNFSIILPELKEGTKTYLPDPQGIDGVKPFDYKINDGYQIISNIIKVSNLYEKEGSDGWNPKSILYYFSDDTYVQIYLVKGKIDTKYFNDSYMICFNSTNYKNNDGFYCFEYKDEELYKSFLNYFESCKKIAGDYI